MLGWNELKITNQMEFKRWWLPNGWIALPSMVNCNRKLSVANIPWKMVRITKIGANNLLDKPKMVFLSRAIHYFWFNLFVHNLCAHCFVHQSTYTCQINYCWIDGEFMKCFLDCIRTEKKSGHIQLNCYRNYVTLTINEIVELAKGNVNAISETFCVCEFIFINILHCYNKNNIITVKARWRAHSNTHIVHEPTNNSGR